MSLTFDDPIASQLENTLINATEDTIEKTRHLSLIYESITKEYALAMDEVTKQAHDASILCEAKKLISVIAGVIQRFAKRFENLGLNDTQKEKTSLFNVSSNIKPEYP